MSVAFTRRSKVLLALVASMTFGSGLLLGIPHDPIPALSRASLEPPPTVDSGILAAQSQPVVSPTPEALVEPQPQTTPAPQPVKSIWDRIVIHDTGSDATDPTALDRQHRAAGFGGCAYHFVITADGKVHETARWQKQELAPAKADGQSGSRIIAGVQICLVGNLDQHRPTGAQLTALNGLVAELVRQQGIAADDVFLHRDLDAAAGNCPGAMFKR